MFDKNTIKVATEMVNYLKSLDGAKRVYGKSRLDYGRGENYGNTPVEYSIIFQIGDKFWHFFTSDMRYTHQNSRFAVIRRCKSAKDFTGEQNHWIDSVAELKNFMEKELA